MTTPTLGAQRVRLDFNPSSNTAVDRIKRAGAVLIDAVNDEAGDGCSPCSGLIPCRRSITDAAGGRSAIRRGCSVCRGGSTASAKYRRHRIGTPDFYHENSAATAEFSW